jgi:Uma2 family endonuclease
MALAEKLKISVIDYLEGELVSNIKHEFINGEVYAMVGVKRAHDIVTTNLIAFLHAYLRGASSCRVYSGEMKIRVQTDADDCFFYPDLHVSCSESDVDERFNCQPKLIVEVLSDSTERYDRAEKFHHYRKLASLEEYVLVAQDIERVECYRRADQWDFQLYQKSERAVFQSVGLELALAEIYEGVSQ